MRVTDMGKIQKLLISPKQITRAIEAFRDKQSMCIRYDDPANPLNNGEDTMDNASGFWTQRELRDFIYNDDGCLSLTPDPESVDRSLTREAILL
ncbi:MAG: hypothetical protein VX800_00075 [Chloroflexota bacterium]|nr:hypothetical protein [Chloroflexota bacterium]